MRIRRLSLDFFGLFTGRAFDFGEADKPSDFHVIHGTNEAGKTTMMAGYLRLLYGFPRREPYSFQHQRKNLRLSGMLEIDGETRGFTRHPAIKDSLRGEAGETLPESAIASHLGGLSLEDYRSLLCLDDETIEKGGEDIANARGDIGRLLFSATAGVPELNAELENARAEADGLYRKRSSKTRLAKLKRELAETERRIRENDVSASAWHKLKAALRTAKGEEEKEREARDDLRVKLAQNAAFGRALPNLHEFDRLVEEVADYSAYPERLDFNPEDLVSLKTDHGKAEADTARLKAEIERAETERDNITLDEERLALAERLDALDKLRSRMETAALDLPRRRRALKDAEADMTRIARELGASMDVEAMQMVLPPADIAVLEGARDAMRDAARGRDAEKREIARLELRMIKAKKSYQALEDQVPPQTGLLELLAKFDVDKLVPEVAAARQAIAASNEQLSEALDSLSVGGHEFSTVPACPIDQITAQELATEYAGLKEQILRTEDTLARHKEAVDLKTVQITSLAARVGVASDDEAGKARVEREALWQAHRARLTIESADAFEVSMKRVDDLDSSRLVHAQELGELRQLERERMEANVDGNAIGTRLDTLERQARQIEERVVEIAGSINLPKMSPAGLEAWVKQHGVAAAARRRRDRLSESHRRICDQADRLHETLRPLASLENPTLDASVAAARHLAREEQEYRDKLKSAAKVLVDLEEQIDDRQLELATLDKVAESTSDTWARHVIDLFGGALEPGTLIDALGQLRDIREHDVKRLQTARQVRSMEADQRQFADAIAMLGKQFELDHDDPMECYRLLRDIAKQAHEDKARRDSMIKKILDNAEQLEAAETRLQEIERQVRDLGALFPETADASTIDALRITVGKGQDTIRKRALIADLEKKILSELSVPAIDDARNLLECKTAPALEASSTSLDADLANTEARLSEATVKRANAERDLSLVRGDAEIAEMVEHKTTLLMQIKEAALDYLERDFGLRMADEAIRRYRDKHRGGMMKATERAFSELTKGAYPRLRTQPEGSSEILLAIDETGTPKQVGDMSKGTRFQLYLALRAAAYEQMVSQGIQLPFFCDDVFETFDEDRTRAACRLMERIGRSGQAIYLTHHRHVVEIAKEVCEGRPVVHEL